MPLGPTLSLATTSPQNWSIAQQALHNRIVDGLFSVLMAQRAAPLIRYAPNSAVSLNIAKALQ